MCTPDLAFILFSVALLGCFVLLMVLLRLVLWVVFIRFAILCQCFGGVGDS